MFRDFMPGVTLTVLTGLYEGASARLRQRRWSVGSGIDNPVVLTGSALEPAHFALRRPVWPLSRLQVRALAGPVKINGRTRLNPGQWTKVRGTSVVEAGEHRFILAHQRGLLWPGLGLLLLAAALAAIAVFAPLRELADALTAVVWRR